jgi:hypothetical protein
VLFRNSVGVFGSAFALAVALPACSGVDREPTSSVGQAIVDGTTVTDPASPILYLVGPQGTCTATLIAPNLVVTARHCVANTPDGPPQCTSAGDLVMTGSAVGQIGADDSSSAIAFYTNARVMAGTVSAAPDAVGAMTLSTNTPTSCRDDLAFIILNQPITGITPAAIRLDPTTMFGDSVSAWGYGLTDMPHDSLALRVRSTAVVQGVGPTMPTSGTTLAPIRAIRIGPDDVTCNGDSGGPITSNTTGAVIAIASLGTEANTMTAACAEIPNPATTGPRLGAYESLVLLAFSTAGATPTLEPGSMPINFPPDAGVDAAGVDAAGVDAAGDDAEVPDSGDAVEGGTGITPQNEPPEMTPTYQATGGSCSAAPPGDASPVAIAACALAVAAVSRRRRRARRA